MFMTCVRYIRSCKIYLTSRVGFADLPDLCLWKKSGIVIWRVALCGYVVTKSCQFIKINLQNHFSSIFFMVGSMKYLLRLIFTGFDVRPKYCLCISC